MALQPDVLRRSVVMPALWPARLVVLAGVLSAAAHAAIWPEGLPDATRLSVEAFTPSSDRPLWDEYGFQQSERAVYETAAKTKYTATAWRLGDPTAAIAAFQWQRPSGAAPSGLATFAAVSGTQTLLVEGNYLLRFDDGAPGADTLHFLAGLLPKLERGQVPALLEYLPSADLIANSQRYILGPASLGRFFPKVPPSAAAFHLGAEAQIGAFKLPTGEYPLGVFSYPTPQIARERQAEMEKLPGALASRNGPLVAVLFNPPNRDDAERLLARVRYRASITWSERPLTRKDNIGDLVINIFVLIGILLVFSVVSGLAFGGLRALLRFGRKEESDAMITLHLDRR